MKASDKLAMCLNTVSQMNSPTLHKRLKEVLHQVINMEDELDRDSEILCVHVDAARCVRRYDARWGSWGNCDRAVFIDDYRLRNAGATLIGREKSLLMTATQCHIEATHD